jgi:citrate lyase subunit beta/citryl-CoA lyase
MTAPAARALRARRSCHAVPGSNPRFLEKAQGLASDQVFLDIEDSVAPLAKADARKNIVEVLNTGDWGTRVRTVRVNDWTTQWTYRDVIEVVEGAGAAIDCIMLPKVQTADQVVALDLLLTQIERTAGLDVGRIGIEAQIENAIGLINVDAIAAASPRVETIIFGPADFMASINMKSLVVGEQPPGYDVGDAYHYILMRILMAARAHDKQAIDGPYLQIKDLDGFKRVAGRAAALGFDGKWTLHPDQIAAANEVFSPLQSDYDHAENILDAYEHFTSEKGGAKGAVMLGDEMIDEASRKMALVISGKGRAAAMQRGAGLRRQVGAAPRPDRRRERGVLAAAERLRPRREHPRRLRALHLREGRRDRGRHAGRRDDRRGQPQDGAGRLRQGTCRGHAAHERLAAAGGLRRARSLRR